MEAARPEAILESLVDTSINALVWVVDAADASRLGESATELANVLKAAPLAGSLLVLLNKADLPGGQSRTRCRARWASLACSAMARSGWPARPRRTDASWRRRSDGWPIASSAVEAPNRRWRRCRTSRLRGPEKAYTTDEPNATNRAARKAQRATAAA